MASAVPPSASRIVTALLLVAAGAVPGALLRWWLTDLRLANLLGCLLLGLIAAFSRGSRPALLLGGVGFCGALTSFSGWILELDQAIRADDPAGVGAVLAQLPAGLGAVGLGLTVGRVVQGWRRGRARRRLRR